MTGLSAESAPKWERPATSSATLDTLRWLRSHVVAFLLCSAALLIPCVWHSHVQACDLGSHVYNAWLSQSVAQGVLPGFHFAPQRTNILIDLLLAKLFPHLGAVWTERVVASLCVLVFFWGSFALVSSAARKPAWNVAPLLAMITYGAIFHWGFFNFYLSAGFSLFGLALTVAESWRDWLAIPGLFLLAALAHPMGAACLVVLGAYLAALRWLPRVYHLPLTIALVVLAFAVRAYLVRHFEVLPREIDEYWLLGADQLIVFGRTYFWIALAALGLCALVFLESLRRNENATLLPWVYFYSAIAVVVCFSPGGLYSDRTFGMMGYLPDRGSLYSAVALAVLLAVCRPRRIVIGAFGLLAILFFWGIYRDTGLLDRRVRKVSALIPRDCKRVISIASPVPGSRIHEDHSVERACIGRCYVFNNYEPNTKQFRLRAEPGNRIVAMNDDTLDDIKDGIYVVQPRDLPISEVYPCGKGVNDLCVTELRAGQQNGDVPGITAPQ